MDVFPAEKGPLGGFSKASPMEIKESRSSMASSVACGAFNRNVGPGMGAAWFILVVLVLVLVLVLILLLVGCVCI